MTDLDTVLVSRFAKKGDRKFFLDLHEYFEETPEIENKSFKKHVWNRVGKWSIPKCDEVYTVNDSLADIFANKYGRNIDVIRNVPLKSKSKYQSKGQIRQAGKLETPLQTVYLGVLNPGRGLEVMIDAIKALPEVLLTIIGDGPLRSQLEVQAIGCDRITFLGALHPDEIADVLVQSQVGWNLLEDRSKSYYYFFGQ